MSKITIQTLYTSNWGSIANIVLPNLVKYAKKHGYSVNLECVSDPYDAFLKLERIKAMFDMGEEYVWSIDCDALITRHSIKVEDIIDDEHSFWITQDVNGINGGSFIVKNNDWGRQFLDYCLSFRGITPCEQDAISLYIADNPEDTNVCILPQKVMNSYKYELYPEHGMQTEENGQFVEGKSFVLHLPGIGMNERLNILKNTTIVL